MKDKKVKTNIDVNHKLTEEELKENPEKAKENFLKNMDENEELRKEVWTKIFWKGKDRYLKWRSNKNIMIKEAEKEWAEMDLCEKEKWYDFVTNDGKAIGVVGELNLIVNLVKQHKGNMKKVWRDLKIYGKNKKDEQKEDNNNEE